MKSFNAIKFVQKLVGSNINRPVTLPAVFMSIVPIRRETGLPTMLPRRHPEIVHHLQFGGQSVTIRRRYGSSLRRAISM